ncbi:hypothetical protein [Alteribacter aurantiacus]|uniref:hypothetical protein n=1 Tax=Alteribacter aurantiacus TaxID=254410 RepID=UPI000400CC85|nr:hypothetical protein [Alteribacter aurantiacus]
MDPRITLTLIALVLLTIGFMQFIWLNKEYQKSEDEEVASNLPKKSMIRIKFGIASIGLGTLLGVAAVFL